jgi:hypothetical protein
VRTAAGTAPAGAVVVAAGPWTSELVDPTGAWRPVGPLWGVNLELRLAQPPRHSLEEGGIQDLPHADGGLDPLFSLVTRDGVSALGSTFLSEQPDPGAVAPARLVADAVLGRPAAIAPELAAERFAQPGAG